MKKLHIAGLAAVAVLIAIVSLADFADLDGQMKGKTDLIKSSRIIDANFELVKAQVDTNATTLTTSYTPDFAGQVLIGSINGGTNAIWTSRGISTNDWQQVAP